MCYIGHVKIRGNNKHGISKTYSVLSCSDSPSELEISEFFSSQKEEKFWNDASRSSSYSSHNRECYGKVTKGISAANNRRTDPIRSIQQKLKDELDEFRANRKRADKHLRSANLAFRRELAPSIPPIPPIKSPFKSTSISGIPEPEKREVTTPPNRSANSFISPGCEGKPILYNPFEFTGGFKTVEKEGGGVSFLARVLIPSKPDNTNTVYLTEAYVPLEEVSLPSFEPLRVKVERKGEFVKTFDPLTGNEGRRFVSQEIKPVGLKPSRSDGSYSYCGRCQKTGEFRLYYTHHTSTLKGRFCAECVNTLKK